MKSGNIKRSKSYIMAIPKELKVIDDLEGMFERLNRHNDFNIVRFNDDQIKKYLISLVTWIDILLGGKEKEEGDINFLKCIGSPVCVSN